VKHQVFKDCFGQRIDGVSGNAIRSKKIFIISLNELLSVPCHRITLPICSQFMIIAVLPGMMYFIDKEFGILLPASGDGFDGQEEKNNSHFDLASVLFRVSGKPLSFLRIPFKELLGLLSEHDAFPSRRGGCRHHRTTPSLFSSLSIREISPGYDLIRFTASRTRSSRFQLIYFASALNFIPAGSGK